MEFVTRILGFGKEAREDIIGALFDIDTVKFGNFILKGGMASPVYIDFRGIIAEPKLMMQVSDLLYETVTASKLSFVSICGVPYTALPFATLISAKNSVPMLIRRKESKNYGTKKLVEGRIKAGDVCLIVEDVVTTGSSVLETVDALKSEGVEVHDAVVLLDRGQGGRENLRKRGINLHSVFTMTEVLQTLLKLKKIDQNMVDMVESFLAESSTTSVYPPISPSNQHTLSYADRSAKCHHLLSKQLFNIMDQKKTNLAFAADVEKSDKLLELADKVGPYICVLKTHADMLTDFSLDKMAKLVEIARKYNFLIFEDRKFADIGETVCGQFGGGMLSIKDWSDFVTVHLLPGPGVIEGLKKVGPSKGCVIVAEMSSEGCLTTTDYISKSIELAEKNRDYVIGFVGQSMQPKDPEFVYFTPGVHMSTDSDSLGQKYRTPRAAILDGRCDVIIVGRGIRDTTDPAAAAKAYQDAGFGAYEELLGLDK